MQETDSCTRSLPSNNRDSFLVLFPLTHSPLPPSHRTSMAEDNGSWQIHASHWWPHLHLEVERVATLSWQHRIQGGGFLKNLLTSLTVNTRERSSNTYCSVTVQAKFRRNRRHIRTDMTPFGKNAVSWKVICRMDIWQKHASTNLKNASSKHFVLNKFQGFLYRSDAEGRLRAGVTSESGSCIRTDVD